MIYGICVVLVLILDRLSKWYVAALPQGEIFSFGRVFEFGYFLNPSLFFLPAWHFIPWLALAVLITLITLALFSQLKSTLLPNSYFLIPLVLGGASNVFDRFAYGGVIDIIHIRGFATLNIADVLIFAGFIGLVKLSKK